MPTFKTLTVISLAALVSAAIVWGASEAYAQGAGFTVGVVDIRKAIGDSKQGKAASSKLDTKYKSLKRTLETKQAELEKKEEDLRKQAATLSQDARERRSQELMREISQYQEQARKSTEEMQKAFEEAMAPLADRAEKITAEIARSKGFAMVIDSAGGGVLFVDASYNITDEVTRRLDGGK
ncbi:MAG: OmpH family outer membrane protein [Deltaproteobacteria bacterium]|jgi:Skp family chaperone for outer membrane proteins|nr:OmpH family outer membrane protein [Deltaproteobacteria bacterium]